MGRLMTLWGMVARSESLIFARGQKGFGLVGVMVATAILSTGVLLTLKSNSKILQMRQHIELRADRNALKKTLLSSTNCRLLQQCEIDQTVTLYDYDGNILVRANGQTRFDQWAVKAVCEADRSISVRVALMDEQGNFGRDPMNHRRIDWQSPAGQLIEKGILCQEGVGGQKDLRVLTGPTCRPAQGSCPPPDKSIGSANQPARMCCDDGSDGVKPSCPAKTQEFVAYWDRQDDWGASGQWVVLCR
jgi:Tfp pilus assembly protein PilV